MKKVVLASLLVCATVAALPSASFAQAAPAPAAGAAPACPPMPDTEYKAYTDAVGPPPKAPALEAYLTAFPQSCVKESMLEMLMALYSTSSDVTKTLDAADRLLKVNPTNLRALYGEALLRKASADAITDPAAKQQALDTASDYAQKALTALGGAKPASMNDADFKTMQTSATPSLYGVIGYAALNKKDSAAAIDAYKKELASVPEAQTKVPGPVLQDTFYLAEAYYQATPPDYLSCAFYASRAVAYAPDQFKTQMAPTAKYCYKKYHGADDGYDAVVTAASANLNPPEGFQASVKPAPTPADIIDGIIKTTPDLGTLAVSDKEYILQNGTPEQADKVWQTIKGKSSQFPGALVIASTPTQLQVAISDDAVQSKTADFTFTMKAPEEATGTAAQKAAAQKTQDAMTAATAVGQTVTLTGTYDSFTPKPIMITMTDGDVVLPKATKAAPKAAARPAAGGRRAPAKKR